MGQAEVHPAPLFFTWCFPALVFPAPGASGEAGFPSMTDHLPLLLTRHFAQALPNPLLAKPRCSGTASGTERGFRHLKSPNAARGGWALKQMGAQESALVCEVLWRCVCPGLVQPLLLRSEGCGHGRDHSKDNGVNGRRIWPSAICRRLSVKQPPKVINSP